MPAWIYVFFGGGLGSLTRWGLAKYWPLEEGEFPIATLVANVIASLILGGLLGYHMKYPLTDQHKLLLMVGFCGGFSTFSTFSAELLNLLKLGHHHLAFGYLVLSLILGLAAVYIGYRIILGSAL